MIYKYFFLISLVSINCFSKDISKLKKSNATVEKIQKDLLPKVIKINEQDYKKKSFAKSSIETSKRLGCAIELAKESNYPDGIFIPKLSSLVIPGFDEKNRFGFYIMNRKYIYFIHMKDTEKKKAYGDIKIDGIDFSYVRSESDYSFSLKENKDQLLPTTFRFKKIKLIKNIIQDLSSVELQDSLDHFVLSALGGLSEYLTKFRVEMYNAKVSQFDDLGLRSITVLKRCHKVFSSASDSKLISAFEKAKTDLKKTIVVPKKPE